MKRLVFLVLIFGTISLTACATFDDFEEEEAPKVSDSVFQPQYPTAGNSKQNVSPENNINNMMNMMQQQMQMSMMNQNMRGQGTNSMGGGFGSTGTPGGGGIGGAGSTGGGGF